MKKHEKHAKLTRPDIGQFGRNEIAFLGAPCNTIASLVADIIKSLPIKVNITYVDADHENNENLRFSNNIFQDKISHKRVEKEHVSEFDQKFILYDQDLFLINGNHFQAKAQVIIINPKKEESLKKRLDQITDIKAIILDEGVTEVYPWFTYSSQTPILRINEIDKIANLLLSEIKMAPLKALILTGGKSVRMGMDKAFLNYHGKPQYLHLYQTLEKRGLDAYISCREDQQLDLEGKIITDKFIGLGPYGAILSAFQSDPNAAWLVVACDMPLLKTEDFDFLIYGRNIYKSATACYNPETGFPDPLFTIWEPKIHQSLLNFLALGYSCPRKVLINTDNEVLVLPNPEILKNINTPEEKSALEGQS